MRVFSLFLILIASICVFNTAHSLTLDEAIQFAASSDESIKSGQSMLESKKYSSRAALGAFLPSVSLQYSYLDMDMKKKSTPKLSNKSSDLNLQIGFNIFNGFSDTRNAQLALTDYDIQTSTLDSTFQDVILNVKSTYINYLKAHKGLEVAKETLVLLQTQKKIAEVAYDVGQFSRSDVLRVDVQLASSELDLLNAQIALKLARQSLEKVIVRTIDENEEVVDIPIKADYVIPELDELYELMENESDMKAVKGSYEAANLNKLKSISSFLPSVNLGYSRQWNGKKTNPFSGVGALNNNKFDRVHTFSVTATWNLFQGFYDINNYMSKAVATEASSYNVSNVRRNKRLEVSNYYENYFSARERFTVAQKAVVQARESYEVISTQYANNEATTTDVLSASIALTSALNSEYSANYDIMLAVAQIERATGTNILGLAY